MTRHKLEKIRKNSLRALMSEVLPYELPLPFDNHGLYSFLRKIQFSWTSDKSFRVRKSRLTKSRKTWLEIIFDEYRIQLKCKDKQVGAWLEFDIDNVGRPKHPYTYFARRNDGKLRGLTIMHPISMLQSACFIDNYSDSILYFCSRSSSSLRSPHRVANVQISKDKLFEKNIDLESFNLEQHDMEYDYISSYFTYKRYNNIYKFYDSKEFQACERKYSLLLKSDISKCFSSIYTHSISWVTNGWLSSKAYSSRDNSTAKTFGGQFDLLMQKLNYNETNGIIIGPELSRIFAEIILQEIDLRVLRSLKDILGLEYRVDYDLLRYVDDYFIFLRDKGKSDKVIDILDKTLPEFKLQLNEQKTEKFEIPLRFPLSIAKRQITDDLDSLITCTVPSSSDQSTSASIWFPPDKAINNYKKILLEYDLQHWKLANFYLYRLEQTSIERANKFVLYIKQEKANANKKYYSKLVQYFSAVIDVALFIYAGAPSASHSIKLSRIIVGAMSLIDKTNVTIIERDQFKARIKNEILSQLLSAHDEKDFGVHTLTLIDCLTYLGEGLTDPELDKVFSTHQVKLHEFGCLSILTLLRHCQLRQEANITRKKLLDRAEMIANSNDPRMETQKSLLKLNLLSCPYLSNEEIKSITGISIKSIKRVREEDVNPNFNWSIDSSYYAHLELKASRDVY